MTAARPTIRRGIPMRVAGHQPDYLPYGGFFARMLMVDRFVLVDHVQFEKKSFQSRNRVAGAAGLTLLSVPVRTAGRFAQSIADVEVAEPEGRWRIRHWRTIEQCYRGTPGYARHAPFFEELYRRSWLRLVDLNLTVIEYLCRCFEITTPRLRSSTLRLAVLPGAGKSDLLLQLCWAFGASEYVSGPGGASYVDDGLLAAAQVRSTYARYEPARYQRGGLPFVPNLSAVDLLFHAGAAAGRVLRASIAGPPVPHPEPPVPSESGATRRSHD
jgi:hypothetical protein